VFVQHVRLCLQRLVQPIGSFPFTHLNGISAFIALDKRDITAPRITDDVPAILTLMTCTDVTESQWTDGISADGVKVTLDFDCFALD
jgi:hypothetical protein